MKLRNAVVVAALAVVGVVGAALAAPATSTGGLAATNVLAVSDTTRARMTVSYTVVLKAKLWALGAQDIKEGDFETVDVNATPDGSTPAVAGAIAAWGNLGYIAVETNYPNWDVELTSRNGGRLMAEEFDVEYVPPVLNGITGDVITPERWDTTSIGAVLLYRKSATAVPTDTVKLTMAIGKVNGNAANASAAHSVVLPADLALSSDAATPVTFTKVLTTPVTNATVNVGGRLLTTAGAGTLGFGPTDLNGKEAANTSATPVIAGAEVFYINVGLDQTAATGYPANGISGNAEGKYSESFTFTLVAAY